MQGLYQREYGGERVMKLIELRNAVTAAIDASSIMPREEDEYFCASVEYSKFEYQETLEVNFYTHGDDSVFYEFRQGYNEEEISVGRRYQFEATRRSIIFSKAIEELRNNFEKMGVKFDGKYL